jgi:hypothetical protein
MRNIIGAVLTVLGAAATLVSPWQSWYAGRHGSTYKFWEVFGNGITPSRSGIMDSIFLVFLVTAIVALAGVLLRSRTVVLVAAVVALGFSILWMVRQGNAAGELVITNKGTGLGMGVAAATGGSLLMLIGGLVMIGRPKAVRRAAPARASGTTATAPAAPASGTATTRAYDSGRSDAKSATDRATTRSGANLTPEEQAAIDKLDEPPNR